MKRLHSSKHCNDELKTDDSSRQHLDLTLSHVTANYTAVEYGTLVILRSGGCSWDFMGARSLSNPSNSSSSCKCSKSSSSSLHQTNTQSTSISLCAGGYKWRKMLLVAWRSGNALCWINEVTLRWARLVLGWVTVYGQVNHLGTKPAS